MTPLHGTSFWGSITQLADQVCGDADARAGFRERGVSSQNWASLHSRHRQVQGIQGLERDSESREPLTCFCKMFAFQRESLVDSLI